jgi:pimeloyl-ACP methyl ester carboxylesterase
MVETFGSLRADVHEVDAPVLTALCLSGLGLGSWFWESWLPLFRDARIKVLVAELPGHGDETPSGSLQEAVTAVQSALDVIEGPVALVGHSAGGLVAQLAALGRPLHAVALVAPLPVGNVRFLPARGELLAALRLLPALMSGRPVKVGWDEYRKSGLAHLEEADARRAYDQIRPWPNRFTRDLVARPVIDPLQMLSPVLISLGREDALAPWGKVRLLADLYEGVCWRYDGVGHMGPLESGGRRQGEALVQFLIEPVRPQVIESEGFRPDEGVGHTTRRGRRGELMKKRSAYGQKKSAR